MLVDWIASSLAVALALSHSSYVLGTWNNSHLPCDYSHV